MLRFKTSVYHLSCRVFRSIVILSILFIKKLRCASIFELFDLIDIIQNCLPDFLGEIQKLEKGRLEIL